MGQQMEHFKSELEAERLAVSSRLDHLTPPEETLVVCLKVAGHTQLERHACSLSIKGLLEQNLPMHGHLTVVDLEGVHIGEELTLRDLAKVYGDEILSLELVPYSALPRKGTS